MNNRYALIIANNEYEDKTLSALETPPQNAKDLTRLLGNPEIGGFQVTSLLNASRIEVERTVAEHFRKRQSDDLILLYFSGHGILDETGTLYLAVKETECDFPDVTAISSRFISQCVNKSNSARIVMIFDCCYGGAYDRARMSGTDLPIHTEAAFRESGYGRVVLTASDKTSYAWEDDQLHGKAEHSLFTRYLIEGIETGGADYDGTGQITVNELFKYIRDNITLQRRNQNPQKFTYGEEGEIVIARNLRRERLDQELLDLINSRNRHQRKFSIDVLDEIIRLPNNTDSLRDAARTELKKLTQDPMVEVANRATEVLYLIENPSAQPRGIPSVSITPIPETILSQTDDSVPEIPTTPTTASKDSVFVSYASEDREKASLIETALQKAGYSVWFDRSSIESGSQWKKEIDKGLRNSVLMVAILSPQAVDPAREWIRYEQQQAQELFIPIIPLMIAKCEIPTELASIQYVDCTANWELGLQHLLNALQRYTLRTGKHLNRDIQNSVDRRFIGRQQELQNIYNLTLNNEESTAADNYQPTIAICGMGGSGKSMLLQEVLKRMGRRYPGGVLFEQRNEQNRGSIQMILNRWAEDILGRYPDNDVKPTEIRAMLGQYGQLLVAFDNVEPDDFAMIKTIIEEVLPPDTTRLITTRYSREARVHGYAIYPLEGLSTEDSVQLLLERLKGRGPEPSRDLLSRLIKVVGGNPLAMDIVAGQCEHTNDLAELLDDLEDDLKKGIGALRFSGIATVDAHTDITISLDRSLRVLENAPNGQEYLRCFAALGVLVDNVSLDRQMLSTIWGYTQAQRKALSEILSTLSGSALIIRDNNENGDYRLHPLMLAYARALLNEQTEELAKSVAHYTTHVTNLASSQFQRPEHNWDKIATLLPHLEQVGKLLSAEFNTLFGSPEEMAVSNPEDLSLEPIDDKSKRDILQQAQQFVEAIHPYIRERRLDETSLKWLQMGLASVRLLQMDSLHAGIIADELGHWYRSNGRTQLAIDYFDYALAVFQQTGDKRRAAAILNEKGYVRSTLEPILFEEAKTFHDEALKLYEEVGDNQGQAKALLGLGRIYWNQSKGEALAYYEQAMEIIQEDETGQFHNQVGSAHFNMANYERAIEYFQKGLELAKSSKSLRYQAENLNDMGAAFSYLGRTEEALPVLQEAKDLYRNLGERRIESVTNSNISGVLRQLGKHDEALAAGEESLRIAQEINTPKELAWALHNIALALFAQKAYEKARTKFDEALNVFRIGLNDPRTEAGIKGNYGWMLCEFLNMHDEGGALLREAVQLMEDNKLPRTHSNVTREEMQQRLDTCTAK
jgi:tetratricopeptide (TPR) repeat protein